MVLADDRAMQLVNDRAMHLAGALLVSIGLFDQH